MNQKIVRLIIFPLVGSYIASYLFGKFPNSLIVDMSKVLHDGYLSFLSVDMFAYIFGAAAGYAYGTLSSIGFSVRRFSGLIMVIAFFFKLFLVNFLAGTFALFIFLAELLYTAVISIIKKMGMPAINLANLKKSVWGEK